MNQMDAVTAFLNGTLNEEVYMEQPTPHKDGSNMCCKLIKSSEKGLENGLKRSLVDDASISQLRGRA